MKKLIYGAMLAVLAVPAFQSCIDDTESLSVQEARKAKTLQIQSITDLYNAQAQAALLSAQADADYQAAAAAYLAAQTEYQNLKNEEQQLLNELQQLLNDSQSTENSYRQQEIEALLEELEARKAKAAYDQQYWQDQLDLLAIKYEKDLQDLNNALMLAQIEAVKNSNDLSNAEYGKLVGNYTYWLGKYNDAQQDLFYSKLQYTNLQNDTAALTTAYQEAVKDAEETIIKNTNEIAGLQARLAVWEEYAGATAEELAAQIIEAADSVDITATAVVALGNINSAASDKQSRAQTALQQSVYMKEGVSPFYPYMTRSYVDGVQYWGYNATAADGTQSFVPMFTFDHQADSTLYASTGASYTYQYYDNGYYYYQAEGIEQFLKDEPWATEEAEDEWVTQYKEQLYGAQLLMSAYSQFITSANTAASTAETALNGVNLSSAIANLETALYNATMAESTNGQGVILSNQQVYKAFIGGYPGDPIDMGDLGIWESYEDGALDMMGLKYNTLGKNSMNYLAYNYLATKVDTLTLEQKNDYASSANDYKNNIDAGKADIESYVSTYTTALENLGNYITGVVEGLSEDNKSLGTALSTAWTAFNNLMAITTNTAGEEVYGSYLAAYTDFEEASGELVQAQDGYNDAYGTAQWLEGMLNSGSAPVLMADALNDAYKVLQNQLSVQEGLVADYNKAAEVYCQTYLDKAVAQYAYEIAVNKYVALTDLYGSAIDNDNPEFSASTSDYQTTTPVFSMVQIQALIADLQDGIDEAQAIIDAGPESPEAADYDWLGYWEGNINYYNALVESYYQQLAAAKSALENYEATVK